MSSEIESDRHKCLDRIVTIEKHLGIETDPNEINMQNIPYSSGFKTTVQ